jgi:hypothetical protein
LGFLKQSAKYSLSDPKKNTMHERKNILIIGGCEAYPRTIAALKKNHNVDIVSSVEEIKKLVPTRDKALDKYDFIFFEMVMYPLPVFTAEETRNGQDTGWFLYENYFKFSRGIIVLWVNNPKDYNFPSVIYPDRRWEKNLKMLEKRPGDCDSLINFVEGYFPNKNKKTKRKEVKKRVLKPIR